MKKSNKNAKLYVYGKDGSVIFSAADTADNYRKALEVLYYAGRSIVRSFKTWTGRTKYEILRTCH